MFCQKCGTLINANLNYCNSCGTKVKKEKVKKEDEEKDSPLNSLMTTLTFLGVFGLGILVALVSILLDKVEKKELIVMIVFAYLAALFGICFMLIKQISKLTDLHIHEKTQSATPFYQQVQISAPNTAQLEEPKQQPISVAENTTKTLDEVLLKRN
jgi:hypothetical protein